MPMAAKHGRMVNYPEGLLLIKSHDTLTSSLARSCDKLKPFYFVFLRKRSVKGEGLREVEFLVIARFSYTTQQTFTCSKSTIETLEKGVKYDQS